MTLLAILFFLPLYLSPEWAMGGSLRTLRQPAHSHRYTHSVQRYLANTQKYTCKRAHTHNHVHAHSLTYTHARTHAHTHARTRTHTLMHTQRERERDTDRFHLTYFTGERW